MMLPTAFLLGLVGSLHCAGMCGPLALAMPAAGNSRSAFLLGRLAYNSGRVLTYCLLGLLFGVIGQSLAVAGLQRWLSVTAGVAILGVFAASSRFALNTPFARAVGTLKKPLADLLQRRNLGSQFALGSLNGLLPCGLVYVACAGAAASGSWREGTVFMLAFGAGTVPMMLGIGLLGRRLSLALRFKWQKLIPASVVVMGLLLILRGMSLGIPYLSPDLSNDPTACHHGR